MSVETPEQPDDEAAEAPAARYQGDGSQFVSGVPARDLTRAEYDALSDEQREAVLTTRDSAGALLYDVEGEDQPAPPAEAEAEAPADTTAAPAPETEPEA
jgi:sugar/nucleoside kinase (ribokinase family)